MALYEHALEISRAMLAAARGNGWEALVGLEQQRSGILERLKAEDLQAPRDPQTRSRSRKRELIEAIIVADADVQALTLDWMHELREVLGTVTTSRQLSRTYGS